MTAQCSHGEFGAIDPLNPEHGELHRLAQHMVCV
jgi:hypothetical protein